MQGRSGAPVTPRELREKAAMLLEHGGARRERAAELTEMLLALPGGGALPDLEPLLGSGRPPA